MVFTDEDLEYLGDYGMVPPVRPPAPPLPPEPDLRRSVIVVRDTYVAPRTWSTDRNGPGKTKRLLLDGRPVSLEEAADLANELERRL